MAERLFESASLVIDRKEFGPLTALEAASILVGPFSGSVDERACEILAEKIALRGTCATIKPEK